MLRSVKYGLYGAVLAGLVAAPVAWNSMDKTVHLKVDGSSTEVTTTASDVHELLADRGLDAGRHDLLAPTPSTPVKDGMNVVLRRGRLLHLDVNGRSRSVWTTAPTVNVALSQLGYTTGDFVSVSRSRRLPLKPTSIAIRTPRMLTVVADGHTRQVSTTEPTVGAMLHQIGIDPDSNDRVSASPTTATTDGLRVVVKRVTTKQVRRTEAVKFGTKRVKSGRYYAGSIHVLKPGHPGKARVTYSVVYVDGKPTKRVQTSRTVLSSPHPKVLAVGTKQPSGPAGAQAIARQLLANYGWSDQFSCLLQMWNNESGWNVYAQNSGSGAYGIPQALPGSKMAAAGPNWQSDARTQIRWGLDYIRSRYGTPCGAWGFWQAHNYY